MKTPQDPRHLARIARMEALFAFSFHPEEHSPDNIAPIVLNREAIDRSITQIAPEWPIDKIARIDLAILRLAVYELTIEKDAPEKVIIDEAVELAKAYGGEGSAKFVNGALGALINPKE